MRWRRAMWTLGATLGALVAIFFTYASTVPTAMKAPPTDLVVDWGGGRVLVQGGDPYDERDVEAAGVAEILRQLRLRPGAGLAHPPTAFAWFLPLGTLSLPEARMVWMHLTLLFALVLAMVVTGHLAVPAPLASGLLLFGLIGLSTWFEADLAVGQLSMLLALLVALAWSRARAGDELGTGAFLGLACTLKVFPGAIVLYFLLRRRWRVVLAAAGAWLAIAVPLTIHVGLGAWGRFLGEASEYTDSWIGHVRNASLLGIFQRLRHPVCELPPAQHPVWPVAYLLAAAVALLVIVWLARRRGDMLPAVIAFSMLVSPYAWEHYRAMLVLPLVVAAVVVVGRGWQPRTTIPAALAILGLAALMSIDWVAASRALHEYRQDPSQGCARVELLAAANWLPALGLTVLLALLLGQKGAGDDKAIR